MRVFALSNWTLSEGRFFNSLYHALNEWNKTEQEHDVGVVQMELEGNEFIPKVWYDRDGFIVNKIDDDSPTQLEGTD